MSEVITVNAQSSNDPIEYSIWDEPGETMLFPWQLSNEFIIESQGNYIIKVRDNVDCTDEELIEVVFLINPVIAEISSGSVGYIGKEGSDYYAQGFTLSEKGEVSKIGMYVTPNSSGDNIRLTILDENRDINNKLFRSDPIIVDNEGWIYATVNNLVLEQGVQYYISLEGLDSDNDLQGEHEAHYTDGNSTTNGAMYYSNDAGDSWTQWTDSLAYRLE